MNDSTDRSHSSLSRRRLLHLGSAAGLVAAGATAVRGQAPTSPVSGDETLAGSATTTADLRAAVETGALERVRRHLDTDPALLYHRDEHGVSIFLLATLAGHTAITDLLLERGLELDLAEATAAGDWERVEELGAIAPGAVNLPHAIGGTATWIGARLGHGRGLFSLASLGADFNAMTDGGSNPARAALDGSDPRRRLETLALILGNGGDVNATQPGGDSILHAAARLGDPRVVTYVVRKGGDPTTRDAQGRTPADVAHRHGHSSVARLLTDHHRLPRDCRSSRFAYDGEGEPWTPAAPIELPQHVVNRMVGACHNDFDEVRRLDQRLAGVALGTSSFDEMTIEASAHMGRRDMCLFLLERGAPYGLPTAITTGDLTFARRLLREDPERIRERGAHDFPLGWYPGIAGGDLAAAALLIEHGLDLDAEREGHTVLHFAARRGHRDLAAFWLEHGADPTARTWYDEKTPYDIAVENDQGQVATLLRSFRS